MRVYTADLETDPFMKDRKPEPFCAGLYDGASFLHFWGADCVALLMAALRRLEPGIVYIHNGGKFDIYYMLEYLDTEKDILIIDTRITQAYIACDGGHHKIRDSIKILPFALKQYKKDDIDYCKLEADVRDGHRDEIVEYLKGDCVYLHELCSEYIASFGPAITIGTTAMKELKKHHDIGAMLSQDQDASIRKPYFVGGRVERYRTGVFHGDFKVYDVNSMYPHVMSTFNHPIGPPMATTRKISKDTFFVTARGTNRGAFPTRTKTGIDFKQDKGTFSVTIHEWLAAQELGLFDCDEILECVDFEQSCTFCDYIRHFYNMRRKAIEEGDKIHSIFYKFLLNNSYGKFAVNPENYREYRITDNTTDLRWHGYDIAEIVEGFDKILWAKPAEGFRCYNVATGASITGAARSVLMRGLHKSAGALYCDTDSIVCESLSDVALDESALGAWKLETTGNKIAIAGRKMYALWDGGKCVKMASKGVRISPEQIELAATGHVVTYEREAPTYRMDGSVDWLTRRIRSI